MDAREQRGLVIAATCNVKQRGVFWIVPSQSGQGAYYVYPNGGASGSGEPHCTCPDHETTGKRCKHIYAVEFTMKRETADDGTVTETKSVTLTETVVRKPTYRQDWPNYNAAQVNEKSNFRTMLHAICQGIAEPYTQGRGRPKIPLRDAIFSANYKVYSTVSGRRFMTDLRDAHEAGFIGKLPCYNSIFNVLEAEETTPILVSLIQQAALPLKAVESHFSCDSSGFSTSRFDRWFDHKWGGEKSRRVWVKCHLMCGVKTNVVTAVEISDAGDAPTLPVLLDTTRRGFDVKQVSADMAYGSVKNLDVITAAGAEYLIPFTSNVTGSSGGLWAKMFHYFSLNRDEFLAKYHARSNVESTFAMIKAKFGDSVRSKANVAMRNEVLAKIVCHNLCCLNSAIYELGINPVFWAESPPAQKVAGI